jgi:monoamine oxidase
VTRRIEADVAIVGAGLAGLTAAHELKTAGLSVTVLEGRDRVGGRLLRHPLGEGRYVDLGGEYFGDKSTAIAELAASVGVKRFASYDEGLRITYRRGRRLEYGGLFPIGNPAAMADMAQAIVRIERLVRTIPPGRPWDAPRAREWDGQTFADWCRRNIVTEGARELIALGTECAYCATPADLSFLHVLYYARVSGGFGYLMEVRGGIQKYRFEGGAQSIPIRMAEPLAGELELRSPVRRVEQRTDSVVLSGPGFEARARRAVIAIPVTLAGRIDYDPPLPGLRDQLAQRMPAGAAIKCLVVYDEPWWRARGLTGQATSPDGPVRVTFDTSPPDGVPGVLSAFVVGSAARAMARRSPAERREAVMSALARFFGTRARAVDHFVEKNWMDEEFTRGCYHGFCPPGVYTAYGTALRRPVGLVHWAGTESGVHQMGSMGGAVDSGRRAAREILEAASHPVVRDRTLRRARSHPEPVEPIPTGLYKPSG